MASLDLLVSAAGLAGASAQLSSSARAIADRLAQLDGELAPLKSDWSGGQQEQYAICKQKWDEGAQAMAEMLLTIGNGVAQSRADYLAADQRGVQRFGG